MKRVSAALALAGMAFGSACGGGGGMETRPGPPAGACAVVAGDLPEGGTMAAMAGAYRLTMVSSDGGDSIDGTIRLEARSGDLGMRGGTATPLGGTADIDLGAVGAQAVRGLDSMDSSAPGVLVLESDGGTGSAVIVRFGSDANAANRRAVDGAFVVLEPRLVAGDGFFGDWRSGVGTERASGYFCAWPDAM